jgi:Nucleotide modification associated domain 3
LLDFDKFLKVIIIKAMKIIFSRKGFDSGYGGVASPIFPDGKMMSLPIPGASYTRYRDVQCESEYMSKLLEDLTKNKVQGRMPTHFDPDLNPKSLKRVEGWRPSLGQTGAAQSHLDSKGVGEGDLFLFFGWFREAEKKEEKWRFVPGSKDLHVLFGYLQIGHSVRVGNDHKKVIEAHPWLDGHPHLIGARQENNTIHVGRENLILGENPSFLSGGGAFNNFSPELVLTNPGKNSRSLWKTPHWLKPPSEDKSNLLSYHNDPTRWTQLEDGSYTLQSVAKGQEFVIDCEKIVGAKEWADALIHKHLILEQKKIFVKTI